MHICFVYTVIIESAVWKLLMFLTAFFEVDFENIKDIYGSPVTFLYNRRIGTLTENFIVNIYHVSENAK